MAEPTLTVRIAFANNPADTAFTWVDVSSYVREFQTNRGRDDETRSFDTGAASIVLDNRDRRFDPSNTASPYYPNVLPMKRINIRATWGGVTYDLFTGFIEDFPLPSSDPFDLTCQLSANDVFEVLNSTTVSGEARAIEASDVRAARLLALAGLPSAAYSLSAGKTDVAAEVGETQSFTDAAGNTVEFVSFGNWGVLDKLREVETAERGQLFVDGAGVVVLRDRHYRLVNQATNQATFGDLGELPFLEVERKTGVDLIFNEARTQRAGTGATVFAIEDTGSQAQYLTRSWPSGGSVEQTTAASDAEVEALAQFIVDRYKQPISRVSGLTVTGEGNPLVWPQALARDVGDKLTVNVRYRGTGSLFSQVSRIERVQHTYTRGERWRTTWALSPTSAYESGSYWKLQDASSQLGTNTVLAF
jgi:hypothetical protein